MTADDSEGEGEGEGLHDVRQRDDVDARYIVPGLARGLAVLQLFNEAQSEMTLQELAQKTGLSRSSVFRLVYTLEKEGFLTRSHETRRYALTSRVLTLGYTFLAARPLVEIVHPYLRRISRATRLAAHLIELDGTETVYLARVAPAARVVSNLQVGMRLPAHAAVSGRVLLAGLDRRAIEDLYPRMTEAHGDYPPPPLADMLARAEADAARGWVLDESTFDPGILSYAAPVRNGAGDVVAALNVIGPETVMRQLGGPDALDAVVGAEARALSRALGWQD